MVKSRDPKTKRVIKVKQLKQATVALQRILRIVHPRRYLLLFNPLKNHLYQHLPCSLQALNHQQIMIHKLKHRLIPQWSHLWWIFSYMWTCHKGRHTMSNKGSYYRKNHFGRCKRENIVWQFLEIGRLKKFWFSAILAQSNFLLSLVYWHT